MGYSVAIRVKSDKLKQKMLKFMEENYKAPHLIFGDEYSCSSEPSDDLAYDHAKTALGFDYSCPAEYESDYIYAVTRWMALKVGKKRKWKNMPEAVPHIIYDGYEAWPVIVEGSIPIEQIPEDKRWAIYTKYCCKVTKYCDSKAKQYYKKKLKFLKEVFGKKDVYKTISAEIQRLDELWEKTA